MRMLFVIGSAMLAAAAVILVRLYGLEAVLSTAPATAPVCAAMLAFPAVYLLWEQNDA
jgi:hypothetical protein